MTIERFIHIKNVGRFYNSLAGGDVSLRRCNLLFAENGRGKTTLGAILRSLQSGDPAHVIGRRTLGSPDAPDIHIRLDDGVARFANGAWDRNVPDIAIFDNIFINENVFAGDAVDTEQRRNLFRIIVGSEGVGMTRRLKELDSEITDTNTKIRNARGEIQLRIPRDVGFEAFLALDEDTEIEQKIETKRREINATAQAARIQERRELEKLSLPSKPEGIERLLLKTIDGIGDDVEERMATHIRDHHMGDNGENWISQGLTFQAEDCPFCGQALAASPILPTYLAYFSEAYEALKTEVHDQLNQVRTNFGDRAIGVVERTIERNNASLEFWQQYCVLEPPALPNRANLESVLERLRNSILGLLQSKVSAPIEVVTHDEAFVQALDNYQALARDVATYNAAVDAANRQITAKKEETRGANSASLRRELNFLLAIRLRHNVEVIPLVQAHDALCVDKRALEAEKAEIRERLDDYTTEVIGSYEQSINRYLDHFNAGFRIGGTVHNYRGRIASTRYQIVINEVPVGLGDPDTPLDQPSFKNTLSAGDRSTLALAFFLAQIEREPMPENKLIVLDDPFTSQDSFRRNHTAQQVKKCAQRYAQVIVLSHDPSFLQLIWEKLAPTDRKALQLVRIGERNTRIIQFDIEDAVQARYLTAIKILQAFHSHREGEPLNVIQQIRPVLEGYCRRICPGQYENQSLGQIVGIVRNAGDGHVLHEISEELEEINDYCRRYHHAENAYAAEEPIDTVELSGYVRRTLCQVGTLAT